MLAALSCFLKVNHGGQPERGTVNRVAQEPTRGEGGALGIKSGCLRDPGKLAV